MQDRYLRLMANNYKLSFVELLDLTNEIPISAPTVLKFSIA